MMRLGKEPRAAAAPSNFRPAATAIILWASAFSLSCRIPPALTAPDAAESATGKVVNTARTAIALYFYSHADIFFHRGVGPAKPTAFQGTFFQRMSSEVTPEEHAHLAGQSVREIMPWLKFAMQTDPHNTEFVTVAAYWMASQAGRQDLARGILRDARIDNPRSCALTVEEGRLFVRLGRLDDARRLLDMARRQWPGDLDPGSEDALHLKREILLYTALLAEEAGDKKSAVDDLGALLAVYPAMEPIRARIRNLQDGTEPANSARDVLRDLIASSDNARDECDREDHDHAH